MKTFGNNRDSPGSNTGDETVVANLKWFNEPKGFGFVVPENGGYDAFLHVTTLQKAGCLFLGDGAKLLCRIEKGAKGAQVSEVVKLIDVGLMPEALASSGAPDSLPLQENIRVCGTVKWYKPEKGFGFVAADDGLKDVFVHQTCLARNGLERLEQGQRVSVTVKAVAKGREAINLTVIADLPTG